MIEVSIVTPTYNRASLILRVWRSVIPQQAAFEWIVVDDGSTDDTCVHIEALTEDNVVYHRLPRNMGVNAARNAGAKLAQGRYVVFLDSDDELHPGSLRMMVDAMNKASDSIGVGVFTCLIAGSKQPIAPVKDGAVLGEYEVVCGNALGDGDKLCIYRREVFSRFKLPESLRGCEQVFVYNVARAWKFLLVNQPGSIVHRQQDNLSSARSVVFRSLDIARSFQLIIDNHAELLKRHGRMEARFRLKAIYRFGVAGMRKEMWRGLIGISRCGSPGQVCAAVGIALVGTVGLSWFEEVRLNRINRKFERL